MSSVSPSKNKVVPGVATTTSLTDPDRKYSLGPPPATTTTGSHAATATSSSSSTHEVAVSRSYRESGVYRFRTLLFATIFILMNLYLIISTSFEPIKGYSWIAPRGTTIVSSFSKSIKVVDTVPNGIIAWVAEGKDPSSSTSAMNNDAANLILNLSIEEKDAISLRVLTEMNSEQTYLVPDIMFSSSDIQSLCGSGKTASLLVQMCSILSHRAVDDYSIAARVTNLQNRRMEVPGYCESSDPSVPCEFNLEVAAKNPYLASRLYEVQRLDKFSIRSVIDASATDSSAIVSSSSRPGEVPAGKILWTLAAVRRLAYCEAVRGASTSFSSWSNNSINHAFYHSVSPENIIYALPSYESPMINFEFHECSAMYAYDSFHDGKLSTLLGQMQANADARKTNSSSSLLKDENVSMVGLLNELWVHLMSANDTACEYPVGDIPRMAANSTSTSANGTVGLSLGPWLSVGWTYHDVRSTLSPSTFSSPCLDGVIASLIGRNFVNVGTFGTYILSEEASNYTLRHFFMYSQLRADSQSSLLRWADGKSPDKDVRGFESAYFIPSLTPHLPYASRLNYTSVDDVFSRVADIKKLSNFSDVVEAVKAVDRYLGGGSVVYASQNSLTSTILVGNFMPRFLCALAAELINVNNRINNYDIHYLGALTYMMTLDDGSYLGSTTTGNFKPIGTFPHLKESQIPYEDVTAAFLLVESHYRASILELRQTYAANKPVIDFFDAVDQGKQFVAEVLGGDSYETLQFLGLDWSQSTRDDPANRAWLEQHFNVSLQDFFGNVENFMSKHLTQTSENGVDSLSLKSIMADIPRSVAADFLIYAMDYTDPSALRRQRLQRPDTSVVWDRIVAVDPYEITQVVAYSNASYITFDSTLGILSIIAACVISIYIIRYALRFLLLSRVLGYRRMLQTLQYTDPVAETVFNSVAAKLSALALGMRALLRLYVVDIGLDWQPVDAVGFVRLVPVIRKLEVHDGIISYVFCLFAVSWIVVGTYGVFTRLFAHHRLHVYPATLIATRAVPVVGYFLTLAYVSKDLEVVRDLFVVMGYAVTIVIFALLEEKWWNRKRFDLLLSGNSFARIVAKLMLLQCIPSTAVNYVLVGNRRKAEDNSASFQGSSSKSSAIKEIPFVSLGVLASTTFLPFPSNRSQKKPFQKRSPNAGIVELIQKSGRVIYIDLSRRAIYDKDWILAEFVEDKLDLDIEEDEQGYSETAPLLVGGGGDSSKSASQRSFRAVPTLRPKFRKIPTASSIDVKSMSESKGKGSDDITLSTAPSTKAPAGADENFLVTSQEQELELGGWIGPLNVAKVD